MPDKRNEAEEFPAAVAPVAVEDAFQQTPPSISEPVPVVEIVQVVASDQLLPQMPLPLPLAPTVEEDDDEMPSINMESDSE
jgi:hypothetical protein